MLKRVRRRLDGPSEQGFTVIEFLVVIIIVGILLAIAVPSYLQFKDRVAISAVKANLNAALPSADAYFAQNGIYTGMDTTALQAIDSGISPTLTVVAAGVASYCLTDTVSGKTWSVAGPGASSADFRDNATCA